MRIAWSRKNAWDGLPRPIRAATGVLAGFVPRTWFFGRHFRRRLAFVHEAQWWPAERLRTYQLSELRRMCTLAYERTTFYRNRFDEAGLHPSQIRSPEDLRVLPLLDRDTIRDHADEMCVRPFEGRTIDSVSTGGTSGVPMRFYIGSSRSAVEYAYLVAAWERIGYRLGDPLAVFRSRVVGPDATGLRHEHDPLLNCHYYNNFHMTDADMARYVEHLRSLGPCFLHVYPSAVAALARFVQRSGVAPPDNIRGVIAESEVVYPEQRQLVEGIFGCRYFSCYGMTEKVVAGAECEHSTDYHVWPTYGFCELLDGDEKPVTTPGARGEIVGTGFINDVMPFIRYRTGDEATYLGQGCTACGRNHLILGAIGGHRIQESLVASDGSAIQWAALNMHDDTFAHVLRFQFYQDTPGRARLRLVPAPGFGDEDRARIQKSLQQKCDGRLAVIIELVDRIAPSAAGKAIYVDQRLTQQA